MAYLVHIQHGVMTDPGIACGLGFEDHFAALALEKMRNVHQGLTGAISHGAC
jgi:hypothetical protein